MVGTRMLYEGLALWRVMLEGCGRIRDLPYEVMRKDGDKEGTLVALPCRCSVGPREQYSQTLGEVTGRTL